MKLHFLDSWLDLCVKWNGQLWNGFTHVGPLYIIYGNQLSFSTLVIDYQMLFLQKIKNTVSSFSSLSKYKKCNWHHDHIFESTMNIRKPFFSPSTQNIYIYIFPRVNEHPLQLYLYFAKKISPHWFQFVKCQLQLVKKICLCSGGIPLRVVEKGGEENKNFKHVIMSLVDNIIPQTPAYST